MSLAKPPRLSRLVLVGVLLVLIPSIPFAGVGDLDNAKIAVTLLPKPAKGTLCSVAPTEFACDAWSATSNLVVQGDLATSYYLYLVVLDINTSVGMAGAALGIDYDGPARTGIDIFGYESCADIEFPDANWPTNPPAGNTLTWDSGGNCQNQVDPTDPQGEGSSVACGFYIYAYSDDQFEVIRRPGIPIPDLKLSDCTAAESNPMYPCNVGIVGLGDAYGLSPCAFIDPVESTTWGNLKRQLGRGGP